ncbi:MAG: HAD-IA family hydrolase [Actinomycetota bacterium]
MDDVLLLDFGGVCLLNPVELHGRLEERLGLAPGTFTWLGPVDPSTDEPWRRMIAGDGPTERDYWAMRAAEVGEAAGTALDTRGLMQLLYEPPTDEMIRPGCTRVVDAALATGWGVSVLSNDLGAFHGPEWAAAIPLLRRVDQVIDCAHGPALKPDRAAYEWALELLGVAASQIVFVDDQPRNVEGAEACGIESIWFDVADAEACWDRIGRRVGR